MKKTISAKRVLNELILQINDYQAAFAYANATGNKETQDMCQEALQAICEITRNLGFVEGVDYEANKIGKSVGDACVFCWERKAVEK